MKAIKVDFSSTIRALLGFIVIYYWLILPISLMVTTLVPEQFWFQYISPEYYG